MLGSINQEILKLKEELRKYNRLKSLKILKSEELVKKKSQVKELKKILEKERKDVERLEGLSISSIFSTLLGNKYERLDKEKEEYLVAKLKYEDYTHEINKLEEEINYIKSLLIDYEDIKKKHQELINEKERVIIKEGGSLGVSLKNLIVDIDEIKIDIKEIREAVGAGDKALKALIEVRKNLKSAKNWGTWDIIGGGLIANIGKHSAIDDANKIAKDVQHHLNSFKKELSDVNEFTDIQVNLSSFASFADFFMDGIFADWFVQTKINDSLDNVNRTMEEIENIIDKLNRNLINLENNLDGKYIELKNILEI